MSIIFNVMQLCDKDFNLVANSVEPDQTALS